jgi:predicted phage-related endonuclease
MKLLLQENEEGIIGERKIKWISVESERFDKKKLKEDLPETYENYVSTTTYRRFSVV